MSRSRCAWLFFFAGALSTSWSVVARATSDDGPFADLLALAGPRQRYAIVAEVPIQSWCPKDACKLRVYAVDTTANRFMLLEPMEIPGHSYYDAEQGLDRHGLAQRYVELTASKLHIAENSLDSPPQPLSITPHGEDAAKGRRSDGTWFVVDHAVVDELESMSATDHRSAKSCVEHRCSSCRDVMRDVDGIKIAGRACVPRKGQWQGVAGTCRCDAKGTMVAFRIAEAGAGTTPAQGLFVGRHAAVEPFLLQSNVLLADQRKETIAVALIADRLSAYETDAGAVVVTGALAHDPWGNGTVFPVVSALPPGRRVHPGLDLSESPPPASAAVTHAEPSAPPSTAAPPSAAPEPDVPSPPTVPPTSGCSGCVIGQRSDSAGLWWWVALGLAWQWRRKRGGVLDSRGHGYD